MSDRFWGGWPFGPPRPRTGRRLYQRRATEHALAGHRGDLPAAWDRRAPAGPVSWAQVVDLVLAFMLFVTALILCGALVEVTDRVEPPPPAPAGAPMAVDPLILVDRPEAIPVNRMPRDDRPEPALGPGGRADDAR